MLGELDGTPLLESDAVTEERARLVRQRQPMRRGLLGAARVEREEVEAVEGLTRSDALQRVAARRARIRSWRVAQRSVNSTVRTPGVPR